MTVVDLEPATRRMADLISGVRDEQLDGPTPCPGYTLGDLLDHIGGLTLVFTAAATKATGELRSSGPSGDASRLGQDRRTRIPPNLTALAQAWRDPTAWSGTAGTWPGPAARPNDCDPTSLDAVHRFVAQFSSPGHEEQREGLFGPVVTVPDDAPLLDRVIALSGPDPAWSGRVGSSSVHRSPATSTTSPASSAGAKSAMTSRAAAGSWAVTEVTSR